MMNDYKLDLLESLAAMQYLFIFGATKIKTVLKFLGEFPNFGGIFPPRGPWIKPCGHWCRIFCFSPQSLSL